MKLVIVESPTKARTIGRFLGSEYLIVASMGHILDLPKSKLGVDVEHDFSPQFEVVPEKKKTISELKSEAKKADSIVLATDPDREGEAIAYHVREILPISNTTNKQIRRIVFHEITDDAIQEALRNPRDIDMNLVDAQTARRVLDRLVGYKLSPLLWQKVRRGLSAGRVQSVALRLIVEREREIEKFKKEDYFTIIANLKKGSDVVAFELVEIGGVKIESQEKFNLYDGDYSVTKTAIDTENKAIEILADVKKGIFKVSDVVQKEMRRSPQAPYTTSTLQQDGARRLGLAGRRTMGLAQKLYEEGLITYHRTDSVVMARSAQFAILDFVKKQFGSKYVPDKPRFYSTKQKLAQEAHEAIRPTSIGQISNLKSQISNRLGGQYAKLYELIWKRAVASQMADAIIESTTVIVDSQNSKLKTQNSKLENNYRFKANGSVLVFDGFLKVNPQALADNKLPEFKAGENLDLENIERESHETPPPPRYNDASLIKVLEEKGIGRPSTYATIVSVIESRQYIGREAGGFFPTPVGIAVNDFLASNFPSIDDIPFTAEMEDSLDAVANGEKKWTPMIKDFYIPFEKKLEEVKGAARVKIATEKTSEKCPKDGAFLVIRVGRFGKFLSCENFPKCDFSKPFVEETKFLCPKDRGKIVVKRTRKGRTFYGCINYPACTFAAWNLRDLKKTLPKSPRAQGQLPDL
ncbi:MAG: type I DNA topoisomerase [Candidatus Levybacteria bacterium]|nr:type I DNA topoisomerase [Candidatus Levybacteria bacterium]